MSDEESKQYIPEPTISLFHQSDAALKLIIGPVGSGKSTGCCIEIFTRFLEMPLCKDGVRRAKCGIIRKTYPELKSTTIKTWLRNFPQKEFGRIKYDSPISQLMRFYDEEGVLCEFEFLFISLSRADDVDKLKSLDLTAVWLNELRELTWDGFEESITRIERYPAKDDLVAGAKPFFFVIADSNAPPKSSWIVDEFFSKDAKIKHPDWGLFLQPPGMIKAPSGHGYVINPKAENLSNLSTGAKYYERLEKQLRHEKFRVLVLNEFGSTFDGQPVFTEYNEQLHLAHYEIMPDKEHPLVIGMDYGRTPAAILTQMIAGQLRTLDEVICKEKIGLEDFERSFLRPLLSTDKYRDMQIIIVGDPSGVRKNDTDDNACISFLVDLGYNAMPAPTNNPDKRRGALKHFLINLVAGQPAYLLSSRCVILQEAKVGGFHYDLLGKAGTSDKVPSAIPVKNFYSHPSEAEEYAACYFFQEQEKKVFEPTYCYVNGRLMRN